MAMPLDDKAYKVWDMKKEEWWSRNTKRVWTQPTAARQALRIAKIMEDYYPKSYFLVEVDFTTRKFKNYDIEYLD